jgi:hypothetical protein
MPPKGRPPPGFPNRALDEDYDPDWNWKALQVPSRLAAPNLYMGHTDKKRRIDIQGSSVNSIQLPQAVIRDIVGNTRKRKQSGTGRKKKLAKRKSAVKKKKACSCKH